LVVFPIADITISSFSPACFFIIEATLWIRSTELTDAPPNLKNFHGRNLECSFLFYASNFCVVNGSFIQPLFARHGLLKKFTERV
jgi:hypothetical protein